MKDQAHQKGAVFVRPPVVAVLGHIDHGKSTLLDYIRKTNIVSKEAGGITQHVGAYESVWTAPNGESKKITFIDTPGHEAFAGIRRRGAKIADIAILVVSAEEGVKPQTIEALKFIKESNTPYIVAVNKIDRPNADINRTLGSLAEHEIYVEGFGGDIPYAAVSALTGQGVPEMIELIFLMAEMQTLTGDPNISAEGVVIESHLDKKKGIVATIIIKDGTLESGQCLVAGDSIASVRLMEDDKGKRIDKATFSMPARIIGWSKLPQVGSSFKVFPCKKDAEEEVENIIDASQNDKLAKKDDTAEGVAVLPLVIKCDTSGSLEAVNHEIAKIKEPTVKIKIIHSGIGDISENDLKAALSTPGAIILGFNAKPDSLAKQMIIRTGNEPLLFDIIYKLVEWIEIEVKKRKPRVMIEQTVGEAKILKIFSDSKDKQIIGGKVLDGVISSGNEFKIMRREAEIGRGKIRGLQHLKNTVDEVIKDREFGAQVYTSIEIVPGDRIQAFIQKEE